MDDIICKKCNSLNDYVVNTTRNGNTYTVCNQCGGFLKTFTSRRIANEVDKKMYFKGTERKQCRHFGCGKELSLSESLAGVYCIKHLPTIKIKPYA